MAKFKTFASLAVALFGAASVSAAVPDISSIITFGAASQPSRFYDDPASHAEYYDQTYGDYADGNVVYMTASATAKDDATRAPAVAASYFQRGDLAHSAASADSVLIWHIQGTLGPIPTVASNIPVLLNGIAYLSYDSPLNMDNLYPRAYSHSQASISATGMTRQDFFCGGDMAPYTAHGDCGVHTVSDAFQLQAKADSPGIYEGFVSLLVRAGGGPGTLEDRRALAFIDPVVTIDPAFLAAHPGTTLSFSRGVVNGDFPNGVGPATPAGAVPEPATWAMMLVGFGLVGGALRRRNALPGLARA